MHAFVYIKMIIEALVIFMFALSVCLVSETKQQMKRVYIE